MPDPPLDQWLARLQAALPAEALQRLTNVEAQLTVSAVALAALVQKIHDTEVRMSATDDQIAAINANLENITGDVQRLNELAIDLQAEIAAQDPETAAKLQPLVDLSAQIADATPEPVTPEPTPAPVDGTDVPADPNA